MAGPPEPAENLRRIAKALKSYVEDLCVIILDRTRHQDLIRECREAGARIKLIGDGDVAGAIGSISQFDGLVIVRHKDSDNDGLSDEAAWRAVPPLPMVMMMPNFGLPPSERTEVRIAFDGDAVVFSDQAEKVFQAGGLQAAAQLFGRGRGRAGCLLRAERGVHRRDQSRHAQGCRLHLCDRRP